MTATTTGSPARAGATLGEDALAALRQSVRGRVAVAGSEDYEQARTVWNAMIDRRPAVAVRCAGAADVRNAIQFAREKDLALAVRGGGHNIAGNAVCDGGLQIDLSLMKSVRIDPVRRTARVEPGVTLGEFDREAQAFGLATPLGINSTTGVAGLTLGGGFGWLSRAYGLSIDNLRSADVVTASASENADLFWGLRGGGGNFGVVTSFEFDLHPIGPTVLAGLVIHPLDAAKDVLRFKREFVAKAPDNFVCWFVLRQAPPLPFLPPEWHGKEILALAMCYAGDIAEGERIAKPLREFGKPIADIVGPMPYTAWQTVLDPLLTPGSRNYWKSHDFTALGDGAIDKVVDYAGRLPSPHSEIFIAHLGGATSRIPADATAYAHRDAEFVMNVHTRWESPAEDAGCIAWARYFFAATAPFATGGVYVNFLGEDEAGRIQAAYGGNYARLAKLKARFDPDNLFSANQNIRPAA